MKKKTSFICQNCSYETAKWMGKCPECDQWNTFIEEVQLAPKKRNTPEFAGKGPTLLKNVSPEATQRISTKINEFDRVLGGGIVPGSLILVGGEPGIGKSTLLMDVAAKMANAKPVLYISGEESEEQVAGRAKRMGISSEQLYMAHDTSWENVKEYIKKLNPQVLILDSIQTTSSQELNSAPGTVSQISEVTYQLMNLTKAKSMTAFVIGHVTKEGSLAGPKILEHMVDTVVYFEGDRYGPYRMVRSIKNRFGNTHEVGIFEMAGNGLVEVSNPAQYFLDEVSQEGYGTALTCIVEGSRTLFVEIQALVVENKYGNGRRTTQGLDVNRLSMMVAIIEKYFDIPLGFQDIYLNVIGGIKLKGRESDLAIVGALLSSFHKAPLEKDTVLMGEVGLSGEIRSIPQVEIRLKEADQLNYKKVITSAKIAKDYKGKFNLDLIGIKRVTELEGILF